MDNFYNRTIIQLILVQKTRSSSISPILVFVYIFFWFKIAISFAHALSSNFNIYIEIISSPIRLLTKCSNILELFYITEF